MEKFKYFRYYYKNIIMVTPGEKALYEQASEEERIQYALSVEEKSRGRETADWNKVKELYKGLEVEYRKYFPITRGILVNYHYSLAEQSKIVGSLNRKFLSELK
jgi:hypothetical protein